ncbi:MAG: hypothetical protein K9H61_12820 [Bacteroidia bacterium]|nr:hypothetical protein [Bacteroidia bacterium]MCF8427359.1 hypothetical protein [Bacteroidia bacterium]MCF8447865.1 hypothetical protein [Bacteroidia bacterium]
MKFVNIFAPQLFALVIEDEIDEFTSFINFLTDVSKLEAYFNENTDVLKFYNLSIEEAIEKTEELAIELYDYLEENRENLNQVFVPLKKFGNELVLHKMKHKINWVRLYAIQVESQYYVITGGAIKQSQNMADHPETARQLKKLEKVREFLLAQGISDMDGFYELLRE